MAGDINALAEELEQTEHQRLQLIGDVAHELRTPLQTIEGATEALMDGVVEPSDEVFTAIAEEAAHLKRLAFDLSNLSKSEKVRIDSIVGLLIFAVRSKMSSRCSIISSRPRRLR